MQRAGLLSYGQTLDDWQRNWRTLRVSAPPALSGLADFEWMLPDHLLESARRHAGRPRWRDEWPRGFVFVAFACTGSGDEWGFAPTLAAPGADTPILYIEHDSQLSRFEAPDFDSFIFKKSLESFCLCPHDEELELNDTVAMLRNSVARALPYLRPSYAKELQAWLPRQVYKVTTERVLEKPGASEARSVHLYLTFDEYAQRKAKALIGDVRVGAVFDGRRLWPQPV
jgi:hypothetical protein